jgi:hypothetical protein
MGFERFLQFMIERFFLQLGKHLENLLLGTHGIRQLMDE